ncbi:UNVERIFIED_CONTAM: FAD-dependent thymidylate synthase, partial [Kocuria sp. CPCC 205274]
EFSQRYASVDITASDVVPDLRLQDNKNRQNSIDALPKDIKADYQLLIAQHFAQTQALYDQMLKDGIAKECARMILPMASPTTIYMTGNIRNWITYINLRTANGTQKEHADLAWKAREIFVKQLPIVAQALGWK